LSSTHPAYGRIVNTASNQAIEVTHRPEQIMAAKDQHLANDMALGHTFSYRLNSGGTRTIRIKDHGSSAMKGDFFIVTTIINPGEDNGEHDEEIPKDILQEWIDRKVT
jgi:hypothetical protein